MTSSTPTQFRPFINGAWSEDNGHASDWPVMNPATGDLLGLAVTSGLDVVDRAAKAASTAFESWSKRTPAERSRLLLRLAQRLEDHAGVVAQLESANVGKPAERSQSELAFCIDYLRFVAGAARTLEGRAMAEYAPDRTSAIRRDPLGVIAGIAPWNYPLMMALWKLAPAIAVGNTAVIKPSELTPLSALKLAEIAGEVLPPGVLNVVTGDGVTTGDALVRHPLVKMVSVTGDVETGKKIARAAADTLKRLHLELGGNAPVLVFADADLDAAVAKIRTSAYRNAGQDCTAGSRVIVEADVYDDFLARFVPAVEELRVGDPASETVDVGPVISEGQQRRVLGFIEREESTSSEVLVGGESLERPGYYVTPTVVAGPDQKSEIVQREIFGPVATVQRFRTEDEAVQMAVNTNYGLSSSVWSTDVRRCHRLTRALPFGTIWINDHGKITPEMPHGGMNDSGYGPDMSVYSLEEYTVTKHVLISHV